MKTYDLVIIGSGPGGYVAAIRAGTVGLKTALIEKDPLLGGTCLHRGCIPTKALLHTAHLYNEIKKASEHGIIIPEHSLDFKKTQVRKKKIVRKLAKGIEYLMKKRKVEVLSGKGKLLDSTTISISSEGKEETIKAYRIIIATGSRPSKLPRIAPDGKNILNSDDILEINEIPASMAIIGAGAVGVEFASIFSSFGTEIHLIELLPRILPLEDEEVSITLEKALRARGMKIHTAAEVTEVKETPSGMNLSLKTPGGTEEITAEKIFLSVGRKPAADDAGIEEAGISTEAGFVNVNEFMQTSTGNIYAIGDILKTPQLAHVASAEGIVAVNHMSGRPVAAIDYSKVPSCTYSHPEAASVGLKEKEAEEKGYDVIVGRFPFAASGKASIIGETEGMVKIVAEKKYGEVLGVHIVGPGATELIAEAGTAINLETTVEVLSRTIHAHPTLSEAMMEAAHDVYGEAIHI